MRIKWKLAVIAAILLVLAVPLLLVVSKIYERSDYRDEARADIARSWTGEQQIIGPMLVINYVEVMTARDFDDKTRHLRGAGVYEQDPDHGNVLHGSTGRIAGPG